MFRACELKDQTYKKTRTLHFSEFWRPGKAKLHGDLNVRWGNSELPHKIVFELIG